MENKVWKEFVTKEDVYAEMEGKDMTEIVFVLDQSGSMWGLEKDTIGGYNSFLDKQKEVEGRACISTVLFSDSAKVIHDRVDINEVRHITNEDYQPGGSTALMDAVGGAVSHIARLHKEMDKDKVPGKTIVVIITDGYENASQHYTKQDIKKLITKLQKDEGWEFIFLGANIDAASEAEGYGIRRDRAVKYCADPTGTIANFACMANCASAMRNMEMDCDEVDSVVKEQLNILRKVNRHKE